MEYLNRQASLTVTQLNQYIGQLFECNDILNGISVRGEISNFKHHTSGHMYFSLKDNESVIKCVMFRSSASQVKFKPEDGMKITAYGRVAVYMAMGQYQLYVQSMEPDGIGALYIAYEQLKAKLAAEGLFSEERKKSIPRYPARVGLITSPTGAAVQDLTSILLRRYPLAQVTLYPALVQGDGAAETLIRGIKYFSDHKPDVIIIGRGGGSIEDLWCFNDEGLARAIAACEVPVISAVGHETDFTICDFVADLRAPTPSAAAELAVPETKSVLQLLDGMRARLYQSIDRRFDSARQRLEHLAGATVFAEPEHILQPYAVKLETLRQRATDRVRSVLKDAGYRLMVAAGMLQTLSPLSVLARGYALVHDEVNDKQLHSVDEIEVGDLIRVTLADGDMLATVNQIESENEKDE